MQSVKNNYIPEPLDTNAVQVSFLTTIILCASEIILQIKIILFIIEWADKSDKEESPSWTPKIG